MFESLATIEKLYPTLPVYISRVEGRPSSYLWFYRKTDPQKVQAANAAVPKDQGEFLEFEQYHFLRSPGEIPITPAIIVLSETELAQYQTNHHLIVLDRIRDPMKQTVWTISKQ